MSSSDSQARLARSASLVALLTLASRILGLVRDAVTAAMFPKRGTDAFFVAFTLPNVLRRLLAEGALTVAFIPVYTEIRQREGEEAARQALRATLGATLLALLLATGLGVLAAPWLVRAFAYGLSERPETFALATTLTRVVFPYLLAVGLTALAMGVLNARRHFATPAAAPAVLNVGIIGTVLLGHGWLAAHGWPAALSLAGGAVLGGLGQLLLQLPALARHGSLVLPRLELGHPAVVRVARLMAPAVFALAIYQINVLLARLLASFLPEGSITQLYFAQRLIEFPIGIFAVALATVAMPELSRQATAGDHEQLKRTLRYAVGMTTFVLLPATAGLIGVAEPLLAVLLQRGHFDPEMTRQTARALIGFCVGLLAAGGVRQLVQVFHALQDARTPARLSALSLLVFAAAALPLHRPLGTFGLALAVSLASCVNFAALLIVLRRRLGSLHLVGTLGSAARASLAAAACGAVAWAVCRQIAWDTPVSAGHYLVLLAAVASGVLVYGTLCWLLRVDELGLSLAALRRSSADGEQR